MSDSSSSSCSKYFREEEYTEYLYDLYEELKSIFKYSPEFTDKLRMNKFMEVMLYGSKNRVFVNKNIKEEVLLSWKIVKNFHKMNRIRLGVSWREYREIYG